MTTDRKKLPIAPASSVPSVPAAIQPRTTACMAGTLNILQEMMSQLLEQRFPPENANAAANVADKMSDLAMTDMRMMHLALEHSREYAGCGFLPPLEGDQREPKEPQKRVQLVNGKR